MAKQISFADEARHSIKAGVDAVHRDARRHMNARGCIASAGRRRRDERGFHLEIPLDPRPVANGPVSG